jgi:hypothetical protein
MVAAAVFPRAPDEGVIDLIAYDDRSRPFLLETLLAGLILHGAYSVSHAPGSVHGTALAREPLLGFPDDDTRAYATRISIRWRWFNLLALLWVGVGFAPAVITRHLTRWRRLVGASVRP